MGGNSFPFGAWPPRCLPGCHWPNLSHGHRLYRGIGGPANVEFSVPMGIVQPTAGSVTLAALGHAPSTRYTYVLRPVAGAAWLETPDASCVCEFETDGSGEWLGNRPAAVEWVDATIESAGQIAVFWSWRRPYGGAAPSAFGVYWATSRDMAFGTPAATANYTGDGTYSHTFALTGGTSYWFAVTARTESGLESHPSRVIGPYVADSTPPPPPVVTVRVTF